MIKGKHRKHPKFKDLQTTACGNTILPADLIGKKVQIVNDKHHEGQVWEVIREGLFNGCVDIKKPNHVYLDIKISALQICT